MLLLFHSLTHVVKCTCTAFPSMFVLLSSILASPIERLNYIFFLKVTERSVYADRSSVVRWPDDDSDVSCTELRRRHDFSRSSQPRALAWGRPSRAVQLSCALQHAWQHPGLWPLDASHSLSTSPHLCCDLKNVSRYRQVSAGGKIIPH